MEENGEIRSSSALSLIEMLGLIYEDFDIDNIEEKFLRLIDEIFPFDRIALLFIKHGKGVLQGKLARGFDGRAIEAIELPLDGSQLLARLLTTGRDGLKCGKRQLHLDARRGGKDSVCNSPHPRLPSPPLSTGILQAEI